MWLWDSFILCPLRPRLLSWKIEEKKRTERRGWRRSQEKLGWVKLHPVAIVKPCWYPYGLLLFFSRAQTRAQIHSCTHPSNPRSLSKHTLSITVRGESAHASESTIKYLSRSSSDFDRVLMLLTALACCNTYWSKHGQSNIVVLLNACERTQKNAKHTI